MLRNAIRLLGKLGKSTCGNATLMVALGMPALIGGTGFAVDTAQWYMWKRELQYAVDQAALAGAWARAKEATEDTYVARAEQEFSANISVTEDFSTDPDVRLADFAGGEDNSVVVTASASKSLPFSSFLTGDATTVSVFAQASFEPGVVGSTSCIIAVEDHDTGVIFGGSLVYTAGCGVLALSDSPDAIRVNGGQNLVIQAGTLMTAGEVDVWFDQNPEGNTVMEKQDGLFDPYAEIAEEGFPIPAASQVKRQYDCPKPKAAKAATPAYTTADVTTRTKVEYTYYKKSGSTYTVYAYTGPYKKSTSDNNPGVTLQDQTVTSTTNSQTGPTYSGYDWVDGSGSGKIYERSATTVWVSYTDIQNHPAEAAQDAVTGNLTIYPGTYENIKIGCNTVLQPGIYIIDGGSLETHAQHDTTGNGVMFILKNNATFTINGGATVSLTAMTASELQALGISVEMAEKLEGMLIYQDPETSDETNSTTGKLNGNASTILNGTIYIPKGNIDFQGTASVTSQCLTVAGRTVTFTGNTTMATFCPANTSPNQAANGTSDPRVRLVS